MTKTVPTKEQVDKAYHAWIAAKSACAANPTTANADRVERTQNEWYRLDREYRREVVNGR